MADLDAFRQQTGEWLDENAPDALRGHVFASEGDGNWGGRRATFDPPEMDRLAIIRNTIFTPAA